MALALLIARLLVGAVFAVAGVAKLADIRASREAVAGFGVPLRAAWTLGSILPFAELCVAGLLLTGAARWGALGAALLLIVFAEAMAWNLRRGRAPECQCFGAVHSAPASWARSCATRRWRSSRWRSSSWDRGRA